MNFHHLNFQHNKKGIFNFTALIFIVSLLLISSLYIGLSGMDFSKNREIDVNSSSSYNNGFKQGISSRDKSNSDYSSSFDDTGNQFHFGMLSAGFNAEIETETKTASDQYSFLFNETENYQDNFVQNGNNVTASPLSEINSYDRIKFDVDAFTNKSNYKFGNNDSPQSQTSSVIIAQSIFLEELSFTNSKAYLDEFAVQFAGQMNADIQVDLYTAFSNNSQIVPETSLGSQVASVSLSFGELGYYSFNFGENITISGSNTYTNSSGAMIFLLIRASTDSAWAHGADTSNSTITYKYSEGSYPPTDPNNSEDWNIYGYDMIFDYNASFEFDPTTINTKIKPGADPVLTVDDPNSFLIEDTEISDTNYTISYDGTIPNNPTVQFNVTYSTNAFVWDLVSVQYSTDPDSNVINWTMYYNSPYGTDSNSIKEIYIPINFTDIRFWYNDAEQTNPDTFTVIPYNSVNQSISIDSSVIGTGNYTFTAQSTNLFNGLAISTFSDPGTGYVANDTATMGRLTSSPETGDRVRASASTSGLSITNGMVNASLRAPNGTIIGEIAIDSYSDPFNYSSVYTWDDTLVVGTVLDPEIPTGVWSFQFRWSNSTAAAAVAIEFNIFPITTSSVSTPGLSFNALANEIVTIEVETNDFSHEGGNWTDSSTIQWDHGPTQLVYDRSSTNGHIYSTTIDLSLLPVTSTQYTLDIFLNESRYSVQLQTTMTVFLVGDTDYVAPTGEYGSDITFDILPLDVTNGNTTFDSTNSSIFQVEFANSTHSDLNLDYTYQYDNTPGSYNFTFLWDTAFERGDNNTFTVRWNLSDYRETADDPFVEIVFSISIEDLDAPEIKGYSSFELNEEETQNFVFSWNITDDFIGNYSIYINAGEPVDEGNWDNPSNVTYDLGTEGLLKGTYNIELVADDDDNNEASNAFTLTVVDEKIPTRTRTPGDREISLSDNLQYLHWNFTDNHPGIFELYINGDSTPAETGPWNNSDYISFYIGNLGDGTYEYTINVFDEDDNLYTETITLSIDRSRPTVTNLNATSIFNNETSTFSLEWSVADNDPDTYEIFRNDTSVETGSWTSGTNISYAIGDLSVGVYEFRIVLIDGSGNTIEDTVLLSVKNFQIIETDALDNLDITDQVYEGDTDIVSGTWNEFLSGEGVANGNVIAVLVNADDQSIDLSEYRVIATTGTDGTFELALNYDNLDAGQYIWTITFNKYLYENQTITQQISVLPHDVSIDLDYPPNMVQGENYTIIITVLYNEPGSSSLNPDVVNSRRSGGVYNISVNLVITYIDRNGNTQQLPKVSTFTNEDGIAKVTLTGIETRGISSISQITASIDDIGYITSTETVQTDPESLPTIEEGALDLNELADRTIEYITEYWIYLIIAFIGMVVTISYIAKQSRKRKQFKEDLMQTMEMASEEIKALQSITGILGKNTETGLPFFYVTFDDDEAVDMSLVSGLTTALSSFLSELQEGAKGFETMERQGISLTSHRLDVSDFIIVSQGPLPIHLLSYIQNSHEEIEERFGDQITSVSMAHEIDEEKIVEILSRNDLKIDLKFKFKINKGNIKQVQNNDDYSKNIRLNIGLLREFSDMVEEANLPMTLNSLLDYLQSVDLNEEVAARIILIARSSNIIEPIIEIEDEEYL